MKLYHVTDRKRMYSIMHNGLIPHKDPHLSEFGMKGAVVNLARTAGAARMFGSWLRQGDWLDDPVVVEVTIDRDQVKRLSKDWYYTTKRIPSSSLRQFFPEDVTGKVHL